MKVGEPGRGARILFLSLLMALLFPNAITMAMHFVESALRQHGLATVGFDTFAYRVSAFAYALGLTPCIVGIWKLGEGLSARLRMTSLILALLCVLNSWVNGIYPASRGADPFTVYWLDISETVLTGLMFLNMTLLMHRQASGRAAGLIRMFASVTAITSMGDMIGVVAVSLFELTELGYGPLASAVRLFHWAAAFAMLWSGRRLMLPGNETAAGVDERVAQRAFAKS